MDNAHKYKRRMVTVLSADVVGYSRMIGQNDELAVTALSACRALVAGCVARHHGRTFGIAGDDFMIEFSNPLEAVRCAMEIQGDLKRRNSGQLPDQQVWLRTGIEVGEVIDENGLLYGSGVNVAARLQEICPSGGLVVSKVVCSSVEGRLEVRFRSLGAMMLKNIKEPLEAFELTSNSAGPPDTVAPPRPIDLTQPVPGFGNRPALAVLPFENLTRDPANDYLSDGFSEDLITGLSHLRWFPVIDRGSSFVFRGAKSDQRWIGQQLGARYLLTGGLRVLGDRLRIVPRLVDSETAHTLWSEQYHVNLTDVMTTLDEVAQNIVGTLQGRIEAAEQTRARSRRESSLDSWSLIWRGRWHLNRLTGSDLNKAKRLFDEVLAHDPDSVEGHIQRTFLEGWQAWAQRGGRDQVQAFRDLAGQSLTIDDLDSRTHMLVGIADLWLKKPDVALRHLEQAIRLNPSLALAHANVGTSYLSLGEPAKAIAPYHMALRLNPQDLHVFYVFGDLAAAYYLMGDWAQAIAFAERSLSLRPAYWYAQIVKIGALARQGAADLATQALADFDVRWPEFSRTYVDWLPFKDRKWGDYLMDGLALARGDGVTPHSKAVN